MSEIIRVFSKTDGGERIISERDFDPETMSMEDPRNSDSEGDQPKKRKAKSQDSEQQEEPAQTEQSDVQ